MNNPDITLIDEIEYFLFELDYEFYKLFNLEIPKCGCYSRWEECCNNWMYCSYMCSEGIDGYKRLFLSKIFYYSVRFINTVKNKIRKLLK